jgi:hypothetical protein
MRVSTKTAQKTIIVMLMRKTLLTRRAMLLLACESLHPAWKRSVPAM